MKILVIAATEAEIALSIKHIVAASESLNSDVFEYMGHNISFCVAGVGMLAMAYQLTQRLRTNSYDLIIQAGIAGSFNRDLSLGEVVFVRSDRIGDLGAENGGDFIDVFSMGLVDGNESPYADGRLINTIVLKNYNIELPEVHGLTVNTVTGSDDTAAKKMELYNCALETMEGAALHYVCLMEKQSFIQVRAVSNYVEKRNRAAWEIDKAVNSLNDYIIGLVEKLPD